MTQLFKTPAQVRAGLIDEGKSDVERLTRIMQSTLEKVIERGRVSSYGQDSEERFFSDEIRLFSDETWKTVYQRIEASNVEVFRSSFVRYPEEDEKGEGQ